MYRKVKCCLTKCVMQFIGNKMADSILRYNTTIASLIFTVIRCVLFYNSDLRRVCVFRVFWCSSASLRCAIVSNTHMCLCVFVCFSLSRKLLFVYICVPL